MWQTKDIIIYGATSSTANIKGIGKTVTLAQALFSLLGYTFFDSMSNYERYYTNNGDCASTKISEFYFFRTSIPLEWIKWSYFRFSPFVLSTLQQIKNSKNRKRWISYSNWNSSRSVRTIVLSITHERPNNAVTIETLETRLLRTCYNVWNNHCYSYKGFVFPSLLSVRVTSKTCSAPCVDLRTE